MHALMLRITLVAHGQGSFALEASLLDETYIEVFLSSPHANQKGIWGFYSSANGFSTST